MLLNGSCSSGIPHGWKRSSVKVVTLAVFNILAVTMSQNSVLLQMSIYRGRKLDDATVCSNAGRDIKYPPPPQKPPIPFETHPFVPIATRDDSL